MHLLQCNWTLAGLGLFFKSHSLTLSKSYYLIYDLFGLVKLSALSSLRNLSDPVYNVKWKTDSSKIVLFSFSAVLNQLYSTHWWFFLRRDRNQFNSSVCWFKCGKVTFLPPTFCSSDPPIIRRSASSHFNRINLDHKNDLQLLIQTNWKFLCSYVRLLNNNEFLYYWPTREICRLIFLLLLVLTQLWNKRWWISSKVSWEKKANGVVFIFIFLWRGEKWIWNFQ